MKSSLGSDYFITIQEKAEKLVTEKKLKKRSAIALEAVTNPTLYSIKKLKLKQRKKIKKSC